MASGRCLCGAVSFNTTAHLRGVVACHCDQCRRQTGSYVMASGALWDSLALQGAENLTWFAASNTAKRGFCSKCGSLMFWRAEGAENVSVMAGCFDQDAGLQFAGHIYCASKPDYYPIDEVSPKYERWDDGDLVVYPEASDKQ